MLVVENVTAVPVAVYVADAKMHTRLGMVEANAQKSLLVRQTLLGTRTSFRVYAFRGIEACPVARVIDIRYSRTPRITVTASDTVVSAYISGDACGHKAGGP